MGYKLVFIISIQIIDLYTLINNYGLVYKLINDLQLITTSNNIKDL